MSANVIFRSYDVDGNLLSSSEFIQAHSLYRDRWRTAFLVFLGLGVVNTAGLFSLFGQRAPVGLIVTNVVLFIIAAVAAMAWWYAQQDVREAQRLWNPITKDQRDALNRLVASLLDRGDTLHAHVLESAIHNWEAKGWLTQESFALLAERARRRHEHLDEEETNPDPSSRF